LILDVGCGDNKQGDLGVDVRKLKGVDVVCDVQHLPFKDDCFSVVKSSVVIEHVLQPFLFLKEQVRVLKPQGTLICEADNAKYWRFQIDFSPFEADFVHHFKSDNYDASSEHLRIYYPECVERLFKKAGLDNIITRHKSPAKKLDRAIASLFPMAWKNLCTRFIVRGKKADVR